MSLELFLVFSFVFAFGCGMSGWVAHFFLLKDFVEYREMACDLLTKCQNEINQLKEKERSDELDN